MVLKRGFIVAQLHHLFEECLWLFLASTEDLSSEERYCISLKTRNICSLFCYQKKKVSQSLTQVTFQTAEVTILIVPSFSLFCVKSPMSYLIHFACCLSLKVSWCGNVQTRNSVLGVLFAQSGHVVEDVQKSKWFCPCSGGGEWAVQIKCSGRPYVSTRSRWKTIESVAIVWGHLFFKSAFVECSGFLRLLCFCCCCFVLLARPLVACGTFSCCLWDLVPWLGIEPWPPGLGVWSLNH